MLLDELVSVQTAMTRKQKNLTYGLTLLYCFIVATINGGKTLNIFIPTHLGAIIGGALSIFALGLLPCLIVILAFKFKKDKTNKDRNLCITLVLWVIIFSIPSLTGYPILSNPSPSELKNNPLNTLKM